MKLASSWRTMRDQVNHALKKTVVPVLREFGFKGSFPHFYRVRNGHIDLACFQFSSAGGSFVVEISFADSNRDNVYFQKDTLPKKLRVSQTTVRRRLGTDTNKSDFWFAFEGSCPFGITDSPQKLANKVVEYLRLQAEEWWQEQSCNPQS